MYPSSFFCDRIANRFTKYLTHIMPSLQIQLIFYIFFVLMSNDGIIKKNGRVRIYERFSLCQFKLSPASGGCV